MIQAIVFFPLIGALIAGLLGNVIGHKASEYITSGLLIAAAILAWIVFLPMAFSGGEDIAAVAPYKVEIVQWVKSGVLPLS